MKKYIKPNIDELIINLVLSINEGSIESGDSEDDFEGEVKQLGMGIDYFDPFESILMLE